MHVFAFLLAAAGVALSLCYSGCLAMIVENGFELGWLKDFGSLDPKSMCVVASSALAVLGALLVLFRKKFAALLLFAAAGICLYCEFSLKIVYPYVRASAMLFAAAALMGMKVRGAEDEYEDEEYVGKEPEMADPAPATALDREVKEELAAAEEGMPASKVGCSRLWGFLLALAAAAAALALYVSGLFDTFVEHGRDLSWLQDFASFDAKTMLAAATVILSLAGALLALIRNSFATVLLLAAAAANGFSQFSAGGAYPLSWAVFILCLAAAACAWPGERFDRHRETWRFGWPCVYACLFGLCGAAFALYQSGLGVKLCAAGVPAFFGSLANAELPVLTLTGAVLLGTAGALSGLFGACLAPWLLAGAAALFFSVDVRMGEAYEFSWGLWCCPHWVPFLPQQPAGANGRRQ